VALVALAQAAEDVERLRAAGLEHVDRLEAALECRVARDVAAVLVERGGADALELAAREGRLEHVADVEAAAAAAAAAAPSAERAGADERVNLVNPERFFV